MNTRGSIGLVLALGAACLGYSASALQLNTIPNTIPQAVSKRMPQKTTAKRGNSAGTKMEENANVKLGVKPAGEAKIIQSQMEKAKSDETSRSFDLYSFRNRSRVLIVFAPSANDSRFVRQESMLDNRDAGFIERDLVRIVGLETGQSRAGTKPMSVEAAGLLREKFGVKAGAFRAILIGKDGHTAYSTARPLSANNLFGVIDAMPMRRDEMKRDAKKQKQGR